ncbi:MAG: hypothetical protein OWQ48_05970 [Desulfurococcus sp.]|nr:hypothetical protein [Desulfurococcus sp.]
MDVSVHLLIDVVCTSGGLSRLEKQLRSIGFSTRVISADTLRAVARFKPEESSRVIGELISALKEHSRNTRTICVETWATLPQQPGKPGVRLLDINGVIFQARTSKQGRTTIKAVWGSIAPGIPVVPGSMLRKCFGAEHLDLLGGELYRRVGAIEHFKNIP